MLKLPNVVSLQNVSALFSIASHNISVHGKLTLNRGGRGEGGDIKMFEMSYFCGHVTTHFVNDCRCISYKNISRKLGAPFVIFDGLHIDSYGHKSRKT